MTPLPPPAIFPYVCNRTEPARWCSDNPHTHCAALARFAIRRPQYELEGFAMSIGMILVIVLVLILLGVIPAWPHSRSWGYGPSGGLGLVVVVLLILLVMGVI
jgi:hypothetical protein